LAWHIETIRVDNIVQICIVMLQAWKMQLPFYFVVFQVFIFKVVLFII
jgi:hypothetical protein